MTRATLKHAFRLTALPSLAVLLIATASPAQTATSRPAQKVTVEGIMSRYIKALGGAEAMKKVNNRVMKMTMSMKSMGLTCTATDYAAAPRKHYLRVEIPGVGTQEEGCDGEHVWRAVPMMGNMLVKGESRELGLIEATFHGPLAWKELYPTHEYAGTEVVEGKKYHKLVLTSKGGAKQTWLFDPETGLRTITRAKVKDDTVGEVSIESKESDYKEFDGLKFPTRISMKQAGQPIEVTIDSIEHNTKIAPDRFDLPADLKK